jgi:predicted site-specific integrase-resolvase
MAIPVRQPTQTLTDPRTAADLAGVEIALIRRWISEGRLKVKKVNRGQTYVRIEDVEAMSASEQEAAAVKNANGSEAAREI